MDPPGLVPLPVLAELSDTVGSGNWWEEFLVSLFVIECGEV